ncbi:MAG: hypothetical protein AVDCRST_MAG93-2630, partial [uncultured Chloroflexia bacterium]
MPLHNPPHLRDLAAQRGFCIGTSVS